MQTFSPDDDAAAPVEQSRLADLIERINACMANPSGQTIGLFAETLQELHAEMALMAAPVADNAFLDWDQILSTDPFSEPAADGSLSEPERFTTEQLAMLHI